jgi:hypothetical protein
MSTQAVVSSTAPWRRFAKAVLYVNAALTAAIGFTGFLLHVGPNGGVPATEPILARELFAIYVGYTVMLIVILALFEQDRRWLMLPVLFLVPLWLDSLYEVIVAHAVAYNLPPSIIRPILIAGYVVAYTKLGPAHRGAPASVSPGAGSPQPPN